MQLINNILTINGEYTELLKLNNLKTYNEYVLIKIYLFI